MKRLFAIFLGLFLINQCFAQDEILGDTQNKAIILSKPKIKLPATIIDGDTVPIINLNDVYIVDQRVFKNEAEEHAYRKLVRDVKKTYPYAKLAGQKVQEFNVLLEGKSNREKKKIMKQMEDEMRKQFEDQLKNLTQTQGRILFKLIDRETGNTSYHLIKELRGSFSAFFWQTMALFNNSSLKSEYDPQGEDKQIEDIIILIELGKI